MPLVPRPDPIVFKAWQALSSQLGPEGARHFFESHVVDGRAVLLALGESMDHQPAALAVGATQGQTSSGGSAPGPTPTARPTTTVNLERHLKILDRKWLVTGYILRVVVPGHKARRIPLNYSTILLGNEDSHSDIEIPLADVGPWRLRFTWTGTAFSMETESGNIPVHVNDTSSPTKYELKDGDIIQIGPALLRVFRLLEPPAELVVASGHGAGERFVIDTSVVRLGRFGRRDNDICLQDPTVSREHASILHKEGKFWLVPESGTSPTVVNGETLTQPRALMDNDQVLLGEQTLLFRIRGTSQRPRTLHSRVATILFSDLRGWTPLAESLPLQDLMAQMDEYFKAMGEVISVHGGTLLTYQGDAIMAVFGAPSSHKDDPWRAVSSAVGMQQQLRVLNNQWQKVGRVPLSCGIGINTGLCMVGEMGHQSRLEYTAMGDTANLAARLEHLTRDLNCEIILSESTFSQVKDQVEAESLGEVTVRGRSVPTRAYSVKRLHDRQDA